MLGTCLLLARITFGYSCHADERHLHPDLGILSYKKTN